MDTGKKFTIIQDSREKIPFQFRQTEVCEGVKVAPLKTGDYSLEGLEEVLTIERKRSTGELAGNVRDARFERELQRLQAFKYVYILCEFEMKNILEFPTGSGIPKNRWRGIRFRGPYLLRRVSELTVKYGVPFLFCGGHAQEMALSLMKRVWETDGG